MLTKVFWRADKTNEGPTSMKSTEKVLLSTHGNSHFPVHDPFHVPLTITSRHACIYTQARTLQLATGGLIKFFKILPTTVSVRSVFSFNYRLYVAIVICNTVLRMYVAKVLCNCILHVWDVLAVVKAQEVLTAVNAQEVLTVVKSKNS